MKKMIRTPALIILFAGTFLTSRAGEQDTTVTQPPKAELAGRKDSSSSPQKICSCQLMNVQTNPFDSHLVGIFAEKTLEGKEWTNYKLLNEFIRREKTYYSIVFVRSAAKKEVVRSATDCRSLYNKLKKENHELELYNILDVDILGSIVRK